MNIVGRGFTLPELDTYVGSLPAGGWSPRFVVVHNTSAPDLKLYAEWQTRKGWTGEQWLLNLRSYYQGLGWSGGPHLFVAPDKVWAFTPLWQPGVHTPSWNRISWGVETVGEFEHEPFDGPIRTNLVGALAILHRHAQLDPTDYKLGVRGLHLHKEDRATTHQSCPGRNVIKAELVQEVASEMGIVAKDHVDISVEAQGADTSSLPPEAQSIEWVQAHLNTVMGTHLKVDGVVGSATRAAVRAFQRRAGLRLVDGIAGPVTRLALSKAAAPGGTGH